MPIFPLMIKRRSKFKLQRKLQFLGFSHISQNEWTTVRFWDVSEEYFKLLEILRSREDLRSLEISKLNLKSGFLPGMPISEFHYFTFPFVKVKDRHSH